MCNNRSDEYLFRGGNLGFPQHRFGRTVSSSDEHHVWNGEALDEA